MVPFEIKYLWRQVRLAFIRILPKSVQERIRRKEILSHVAFGVGKLLCDLSISGKVVNLEDRYIRMQEGGIVICADISRVQSADDPHLACLIITYDPDVFFLAYEMFLHIASMLNVRLRLEDGETFWKAEHDSSFVKNQIAGAVSDRANLWLCLGCSALRLYGAVFKGYLGECLFSEFARLSFDPDGAYIEESTNCGFTYLKPINRDDLKQIGII
jgi:hypothetical protein